MTSAASPAGLPAALGALSGTYTLDPAHTRIGFVARHAMVTKVRGAFNDVAGSGTIRPGSGGEVTVTIQAASVDTRNGDRDAHLRGADFFDVEQYPVIRFASTSVRVVGADTLEVTGGLTIRDVTRTVVVPLEYQGSATDPFGNERVGFEGAVQVSRKDFGLTWNAALEAGGVLVGDQVTLEFEVSAIKSA